MVKMKKKALSLIIAASMLLSAVTAAAQTGYENIYSIESADILTEQYALSDETDGAAELLDDDGSGESDRQDVLYSAISKLLDEKLDGSPKQTVTLGKLDELKIDFNFKKQLNPGESPQIDDYSDDFKIMQTVSKELLENYNIANIALSVDDKTGMINSITVDIDNTVTPDVAIEALVDAANKVAGEIKSGEKFSEYETAYVYEKGKSDDTQLFTLKLLKDCKDRILTGIQIAEPSLCFIKSSWKSGVHIYQITATERCIKSISFSPTLETEYLDITKEEYDEFTKKADKVYNSLFTDTMTDAEKVMAVHDWIINNVKYGYRVSTDALEKYFPAADGFDSCISEADKANIGDSIVIYDLTMYDNLYAIAQNRFVAEYNKNIEKAQTEQEILDARKEYDDNIAQLDADMKAGTDKSHTAYAPLMEGNSVCQGYSLLYSLLLEKAGFETGTVTSKNLGHQWSLIKIGDGWYHSDATWDDPSPIEPSQYITLNTSLYAEPIYIPYQGIKADGTPDDYLNYDYFLCSTEQFSSGKTPHIKDDDVIEYFPENIQCGSDEYADKTAGEMKAVNIPDLGYDIKVSVSEYVIGTEKYKDKKLQKSSIYYNKVTEKYYYYVYLGDLADGTKMYLYYESAFRRTNDEGSLSSDLIREITKEEYDRYTNLQYGYKALEIQQDDIINDTVDVSAEIIGESCSVDNIGTTVVTLKPAENTETPLKKVDAYLVYYGENNEMLKIAQESVDISDDGTRIEFNENAPGNAVLAKIIILDGGGQLAPVIKAISAGTVETQPVQPQA